MSTPTNQLHRHVIFSTRHMQCDKILYCLFITNVVFYTLHQAKSYQKQFHKHYGCRCTKTIMSTCISQNTCGSIILMSNKYGAWVLKMFY